MGARHYNGQLTWDNCSAAGRTDAPAPTPAPCAPPRSSLASPVACASPSLCPLLITVILDRWQPFIGNSSLVFAKGALATTIVTTIVWLMVTLLTKPEPDQVFVRFYRHVRPDVRGWKRIAAQASDIVGHRNLGSNLGAWALGCAMVYLCLFGTGKILLHQPATGILLLVGSAICAVLLYRGGAELQSRVARGEQRRAKLD